MAESLMLHPTRCSFVNAIHLAVEVEQEQLKIIIMTVIMSLYIEEIQCRGYTSVIISYKQDSKFLVGYTSVIIPYKQDSKFLVSANKGSVEADITTMTLEEHCLYESKHNGVLYAKILIRNISP